VRPGDVIDIEITRRKFHAFDKETEQSIRKRIPEENIVNVDIVNNTLRIAGESLALPKAIASTKNYQNVELVMPVSALTIGKGTGKAKIQWFEKIEGKTLYFLDVNGTTLFSLEDGNPRFSVGSVVNFDVDMCKISVPACHINPMNTVNSIDGEFIKEKIDKKNYDFYMTMAGHKLHPTNRICEKLFGCKGTKIFRTPLNYSFDASAVSAMPYDKNKDTENAINGKVAKIVDYGYIRYAICDCNGSKITAAYDGKIGDLVSLKIDVDKITVKDKTIDIIIV
jgi:hypothetical protein